MKTPDFRLICLCADKDAKTLLEVLLRRLIIESLPEPIFQAQMLRVESHSNHDNGCLTNGVEYLRGKHYLHTHALLIFDYEGCGSENAKKQKMPSQIERVLKLDLCKNGWTERNCEVIVINPELENWLWVPQKKAYCKFVDKSPFNSNSDVFEFLTQNNFLLTPSLNKPLRPKEALEVLVKSRTQTGKWSASLFKKYAEHVDYSLCQEPSFLRLRAALGEWLQM